MFDESNFGGQSSVLVAKFVGLDFAQQSIFIKHLLRNVWGALFGNCASAWLLAVESLNTVFFRTTHLIRRSLLKSHNLQRLLIRCLYWRFWNWVLSKSRILQTWICLIQSVTSSSCIFDALATLIYFYAQINVGGWYCGLVWSQFCWLDAPIRFGALITIQYLLTVLHLLIIWALHNLKGLNGTWLVEGFVLTVECNYATLGVVSNLGIINLPLTQSEHRIDWNVEFGGSKIFAGRTCVEVHHYPK